MFDICKEKMLVKITSNPVADTRFEVRIVFTAPPTKVRSHWIPMIKLYIDEAKSWRIIVLKSKYI